MGFAIVVTFLLLGYQRFVVRRTGSVLIGADASITAPIWCSIWR